MAKLIIAKIKDSYENEKGEEIPYEDVACGIWRGDIFRCASFDADPNSDILIFSLTKDEFKEKCTEIMGEFEI